MADAVTKHPGLSGSEFGDGAGRNTNGGAGPEGPASSDPAALVEKALAALATAARIAGIPAVIEIGRASCRERV